MNLSSLKSLQERIRAATGPSRELDAEVYAAFNNGAVFKDYCDVPDGYISRVGIGRSIVSDFPNFTTYPEGLGACVALKDEVLPPHVQWERYSDGSYRFCNGSYRGSVNRPLANDCLTFIDAIVSAKISQLETEAPREERRYDPLDRDYDNEVLK